MGARMTNGPAPRLGRESGPPAGARSREGPGLEILQLAFQPGNLRVPLRERRPQVLNRRAQASDFTAQLVHQGDEPRVRVHPPIIPEPDVLRSHRQTGTPTRALPTIRPLSSERPRTTSICRRIAATSAGAPCSVID
jgi:hypothetical protein